MAIEILMPALSPTMEEGTLAKWLVEEGAEVRSGDVIAEIETDKATMEVEAVEVGKLGKILVPDGTEGVPVNNVIALLLEEGRVGLRAHAHACGSGRSDSREAERDEGRPRRASSGETAPRRAVRGAGRARRSPLLASSSCRLCSRSASS